MPQAFQAAKLFLPVFPKTCRQSSLNGSYRTRKSDSFDVDQKEETVMYYSQSK